MVKTLITIIFINNNHLNNNPSFWINYYLNNKTIVDYYIPLRLVEK